MGWVASAFEALTDAGETRTQAGRALLEQRFRSLQGQIPLLYTVALTNYLGLYLATGGTLGSIRRFSTLLVGLVVLRLFHWLRVRGRALPPERIRHELRKTWIYALIISVGFSCWALYLIETVPEGMDNKVILFGSLAAVG